MTARREFLAGLAGVTVAAGAVVAAGASPDPDAALFALVDDLQRATAEVERAAHRWYDAQERASARIPPLPDWRAWAEANHPRGPFLNHGGSVGHGVLVDLLRRLPAMAGGNIDISKVDWEGRDGEAIADAMVKAEREYYAELRPAYDAMVAEHRATVAKIDEAEGVTTADEAVAEAERCQGEALAALQACRPKTPSGFVQKVAALMAPLASGEFEIDGEPATILADARALIGDPA